MIGDHKPKEEDSMATVQVRYIVNDVDAAIAFYCQHLGFREVTDSRLGHDGGVSHADHF